MFLFVCFFVFVFFFFTSRTHQSNYVCLPPAKGNLLRTVDDRKRKGKNVDGIILNNFFCSLENEHLFLFYVGVFFSAVQADNYVSITA